MKSGFWGFFGSGRLRGITSWALIGHTHHLVASSCYSCILPCWLNAGLSMKLNSRYLLHLWQLPCLNKKGRDSWFWSAYHCTFCHVCLAHISVQSLDSDHSDLCTSMQTGFREDRNTLPLPSMWQSGTLQLLVQKPSLILLTLLLCISWNFFRTQHSHPSGRQLGLPGVAGVAGISLSCLTAMATTKCTYGSPLLKLPLWAQGL